MRKRITSLLLTLVMLLSLVPALGGTARAAEEDDGVVHVFDYDGFYRSFYADGITIVLEDDLVSVDPVFGGTTLYESLWVQPFRTVTIDLNGHKLELSASTGGDTKDGIIHINNGTLTIKDSSPGQTGEIYGSFPGGGVKRMHSVIDMEGDLSRFDLEGGTITGENCNALMVSNGLAVIKGGTLRRVEESKREESYDYPTRTALFVSPFGSSTGAVAVEGGTVDGDVFVYSNLLYKGISTARKPLFEVLDGTFLGEVFVSSWITDYTNALKVDSPVAVIRGGEFHGGVRCGKWLHQYEQADGTFVRAYPLIRLYGGTFYNDVNLVQANTVLKHKLRHNYWLFQGIWDIFGHSAVDKKRETTDGNIVLGEAGVFVGPNVWYAFDYANYDSKDQRCFGYPLRFQAREDEPVTILPNAWGPAKIRVNGQSLEYGDYGKDWSVPEWNLYNDEEHELVFSWPELPQVMKDDGYTYNVYMDVRAPGIEGGVQRTYITDKTAWTYTIPQGGKAGAYSFDLHLDLKKDDKDVSPVSNEYILRLRLNYVTDPLPALTGRVYHPSAIVYGRPISTAITGLPEELGESGLSYQWQRQSGSGAWQDISGATGKSYTPTEADLGENVRIRVTATAAGYLGKLAGASLTVSKEVQDREPVTPEVQVPKDSGSGYTRFHISSSYASNQEYVYSTTRTDGWPTGSDVKKVSDYGLVDGLTDGETYYLYTRLKETATHKAGSKVICKTVFMGDPENLTKLVLSNDGVPYADYGKGSIIFVPKGESVTLEVGTNPSGANQWNAYKFQTPSAELSSYYTVETSNGTNAVEANEKITSITITGTAPGRDDLVAEYSGHTPQYYGSWQVVVYEDPADISGYYIRFETTPSAFPDMTLNKGQSVALPAYQVSTFPENAGSYQYKWLVGKYYTGVGVAGTEYVADNGYLAVSEDGTTLKALAAHEDGVNPAYKTVALCAVKSTEVIPLVSYQATVEEEPEIALTGIILSHEQVRLKSGDTFQLTAAKIPADAPGDLTWDSDNEDIATVDNNGLVTAVGPGYATIEVACGSESMTCEVLVDHTEHDYHGQDWITLDPANHEMVCKDCGDYEIQPHSFNDWQKVNDTTHRRTCTVCRERGASIGTHYTQTANHNWQWVTTVEATPTTPGMQVLQCAQCGAVKPGSETSLPVLQSINVENLYAAAPVVDMPAEMAVANDITHYVASTQWMDPAGNALNMDEAFKPNTVYSAKIILEAVDGYVFTASTTYNAIGGKNPVVSPTLTGDASADTVVLIYTFDKTGSDSSTGGGGGGGVTTYAITVKDAKNGAVTASHKSAAKGTTVTLTAKPDKGYVLDTITVLDSKDKEIKLTSKDGKFTFPMPDSAVTVKASFKAEAPSADHPFTDVPGDSWFEDAVIWAVDKGITGGTSATTFSPDGICTRAQAVTFLWRAAGSPAPKSSAMPFTDVPAGSWYYDAVLWAVEQGITAGTSATTFAPDLNCSRAQIVTFLYRAAGSPAVSGSPAFSDVAPDAYYAKAVKWAQSNGVTSGIGGGLFGSNNSCTRAQIVTFIWRSAEK